MAAMPTYFTEVAPPHSRGLITGAHGIFINLGYCLAGWIGYGIHFVAFLNIVLLNNNIPLDLDAILPRSRSLRGVSRSQL